MTIYGFLLKNIFLVANVCLLFCLIFGYLNINTDFLIKKYNPLIILIYFLFIIILNIHQFKYEYEKYLNKIVEYFRKKWIFCLNLLLIITFFFFFFEILEWVAFQDFELGNLFFWSWLLYGFYIILLFTNKLEFINDFKLSWWKYVLFAITFMVFEYFYTSYYLDVWDLTEKVFVGYHKYTFVLDILVKGIEHFIFILFVFILMIFFPYMENIYEE